MVKRVFSPIIDRFFAWIEAAVAFCLLWISVPLLRWLFVAWSAFFGFCRKFVLFFIKRAQRFYTIYTARKYASDAEKELRDKGISAAIREAMFGKAGR